MPVVIRRVVASVSALLFSISVAAAQQDRLTARIDNSRRVVLRGNINPRARAEFDRGAVADSLKITGVTLHLQPSSSQQSTLKQLLEEQQNPSSPNFHKWLTPEQYADNFGASQSDVDKITAWLESQGFKVTAVARGRNWITFSGTSAQIRNAFQTQLHSYTVNGVTHYANATEPSIPASLQGLVASIRGLDNFKPQPRLKKADPEMTTSRGGHFIVPDDFATIYNVAPLYAAGIDGTGQKIVVVGQTQINQSDIATFRSNLKLPAQTPQTILVPGHDDPGISQDDLPEADLDIEWSGGVARNASIIFVYSANVFDAMQYAIDQNLAPVMTMSYGTCEASDHIDLPTFQALAQQANSQGMTWMAAAGDSGAADCEYNDAIAQSGLSVDIPGIVPEVTAVGGTQFNENGGTFWKSSNNANQGSAIEYIPELVWNSTDAAGLAAGGGGVSTYFSKPSWQTGPGVPNDGFRDVPDVSFAASPAHDPFYVVTSGSVQYYGGTSVAAPSFAAVVALLNQYLVSSGIQTQPGVGNINPTLYRLAQNTSGVFHDITGGNNSVPCASGSPNCTGAGNFGYTAGPGYDTASGLGSVNAENLVHQWSSVPPVNSAVVASVDQNPVFQNPSPGKGGNPWSFTLTLTEEGGVGTTLTGYSVNGQDESSQISTLFGGSKIPANGSISTTLGYQTLNVPQTIQFTFSGVDATGQTWSTQLAVPFQAAQVQNNIAGINNAASGQSVFAPGMILSVYGVQMANGVSSAFAIPLPNFMSGISAYINNVPAPLYYVSPTQLNIQIPYETQPGAATLEVDTPYLNTQYQFTVAKAAPGIFTFADGSVNPSRSGSRGQIYTLFVTGEGQVAPSLATGATPSPRTSVSSLPKPTQPYNVTIGGVNAPIQFIGIPSGLVGVTQINFTVPDAAPLGSQPVVVTVGGVASQTATFTVTN